jgi:PAS domain-containing protein
MNDLPSQAWTSSHRSRLPVVTLGAGVLLSAMLMIIIRLANWAHGNYRQSQLSQARSRTIFENSPVGITVVDDQGRFQQTNTLFQQMLGYSSR